MIRSYYYWFYYILANTVIYLHFKTIQCEFIEIINIYAMKNDTYHGTPCRQQSQRLKEERIYRGRRLPTEYSREKMINVYKGVNDETYTRHKREYLCGPHNTFTNVEYTLQNTGFSTEI